MKPDTRRRGADMRKPRPGEVSIGKPDIPTRYTSARVLLGGLAPDEAERRAMVSRIMGPGTGRNTPRLGRGLARPGSRQAQ